MSKIKSCCCPKRRRRSKCRRKKCYKPGVLTRNPFLNFLRKYRREHCGKSILQIAAEGARKWNCMTDEERCRYKQQAWKIPKCRARPRRRCPPRRRRRRCSRPRRRVRSCSCKRKRRRRRSRSCRPRPPC